ncbi:MAG: membrane protein [Actinophytocola sp.]|nr:membrane protein [Actinophytocola sp.]
MATRPPVSMPKLTRRSRILLSIGGAALLVLMLGSRVIGTYVDWLWYGEVEARNVFTTVLITRVALFFAVGLVVGGAIAISLIIAYRTRPVFVPVASEEDPLARYRSTVVARVRLFGIGIPVLIGLIAGATAQAEWETVQLFFNGGEFGRVDPEFGKDIGFYVFNLPFYNWLISWGFVVLGLSFVAAGATHYLFGGIRLAGRGGAVTNAARIQLAVTAGIFVLVKAVEYFVDRYNVLLSGRNDLFTGASYTDLNAVMPAKLILMSIAVICAIALFAGVVMRNLVLPAIALVLLLVSGILVGSAWPFLLERFSVSPNAIQKEAESIERNMQETRYAYGLEEDRVKYIDYEGAAEVSAQDVANDTTTMPNVRLLDPSILNKTFTQQQQRRNFYGFPDSLDIDRYTIDGKKQDYVVALREIDTGALAENQQNWISKHLVFTHGNGFIAAPANTVQAASEEAGGQGGYPRYMVNDTTTKKSAINVDQPRVYYGELMNDYAIVGSPESPDGEYKGEYDTPTETHRYQGSGGVPIDSFFHRLLFMVHHGERNILFSDVIGDDSKIMYNRNPQERVEKKAPWLTVDGDSYPAVIDGKVKWIVDGYTTTANFPYAQKTQLGEAIETTRTGARALPNDKQISYIRNSVKATVDAYDGSVELYAFDEKDPVLNAWQSVFPETVTPKSEISEELEQHFRYPEDMFKVQRELLAKYHVTNPATFFSGEDRWSIPSDPTMSGAGGEANQPPYYILAADPQKPDAAEPQFQLTSVLTPYRRQFMSAFVSVSSEPGNYGQMTVRRLPGDTQTRGPQQVQNDFLSSSKVSSEINILTQQQTQVTYGNLLTLPVADGLIYVEPVYIERTGQESSFPQLNRVLVYHGGKVGYAANLKDALEQVLGEGAGKTTTEQVGAGENPAEPAEPAKPAKPGEGSAEMQEAADDMQAAAAKLFQARKDGDYEAEAEALGELEAAREQYDEAKTANGG